MRKLLLLLPGLLFCGGFGVAPFDAGAVAKATAARRNAIEDCAARTDFKSDAEIIDCTVAADTDLAKSIRLRDTRLLADYAGRIKALESDIAAGGMTPADITARFHDAQNAFFKAVNNQYYIYQSDVVHDRAREVAEDLQRIEQGSRASSMNSMGRVNGMGN